MGVDYTAYIVYGVNVDDAPQINEEMYDEDGAENDLFYDATMRQGDGWGSYIFGEVVVGAHWDYKPVEIDPIDFNEQLTEAILKFWNMVTQHGTEDFKAWLIEHPPSLIVMVQQW